MRQGEPPDYAYWSLLIATGQLYLDLIGWLSR